MDFFQALEQAQAMLKDFAHVIGTYFKALVAEGFTRDEALDLCLAWQRDILNQKRDD